ncbi:hypothetical protein [Hydrogenophaga laconesensis]|uniref:Uncharacterized protein n=1 Tax=Hydrogenophaga laconesensis TaxID=1805971 RepID=A0ABU1VA80_9BURK|nr:hypothetical protein [Hydrogenophaga laconesensis]MDR7094123.1 hypothetical protein [Hydrogenophaga laconesensis]
MSDRELLEKAAKAAGIELEWVGEGSMASCFDPASEQEWWNPLGDDGDAFRLAVKLGIQVCWHASLGYATAYYDYGSAKREEYGADPYAATRRAIVRAAASLGEKM